jgi:hypothetical protein
MEADSFGWLRMSGTRIFICYRRDDSAGYARSLYDRLQTRFSDQVFMDVSGIDAGVDFVEAINREVASCGVLIALIGKRWIDITDARGRRRLDDPNEYGLMLLLRQSNRHKPPQAGEVRAGGNDIAFYVVAARDSSASMRASPAWKLLIGIRTRARWSERIKPVTKCAARAPRGR